MIPTFDRENYHMQPSDKSHVRNPKHDSYKDMLKKTMNEACHGKNGLRDMYMKFPTSFK